MGDLVSSFTKFREETTEQISEIHDEHAEASKRIATSLENIETAVEGGVRVTDRLGWVTKWLVPFCVVTTLGIGGYVFTNQAGASSSLRAQINSQSAQNYQTCVVGADARTDTNRLAIALKATLLSAATRETKLAQSQASDATVRGIHLTNAKQYALIAAGIETSPSIQCQQAPNV